MTDPNTPAAYRVRDTRSGEIVGQFPSMRAATAHCEEIEPKPPRWDFTFRYIVEPVRPCDHEQDVAPSGQSGPRIP